MDNLWPSRDEKPWITNCKNEGPSWCSGATLKWVQNVKSSTRRTWRLAGQTRLYSSLTSGVGGALHRSALMSWPAQDSRPAASGCWEIRKTLVLLRMCVNYTCVFYVQKTWSKSSHRYIVWIEHKRDKRPCNLFLSTSIHGKLLWICCEETD